MCDRHRRLGALLLAVPVEYGDLRYAAGGVGFTQAKREQLQELLVRLERPDPPVPLRGGRAQRWRPTVPFSAVHWAEPVLVGEIAYRSVTEGRSGTPPERVDQHTVRVAVRNSDAASAAATAGVDAGA